MTDAPDDPIKKAIAEDIEKQKANARSGQSSVYSCPDCGGVLWEFDEEFECHTGHRWSADKLLNRQTEELRSALMAAVRVLKEKAILLRQIASKAEGTVASGRLLENQADEHERYAALINTEILSSDAPPTSEAIVTPLSTPRDDSSRS
jgi:two-component system, chemotaxis family, protein-glutamate methylesterase/glutaminase